MGALREILAVFDIDTSGLEKAEKKGGGAISGLKEAVGKAGAAIGGGLLVSSLKNMVTDLVEQGSALNDLSQQLGINTDDLQAWQFAAKLNGVEAGELSASLTKLQKNMVDNAKGGAESGGAFQKLGVSLRDAHGNMRDTTEVLYDTGLAIAKLPPGAEQTAAAMEVFGKAGKKLLPLFADGEAGLQKYLGEVERLGGGISGKAVEQLDDLGDNMDRLEMATTSAKSQLVLAFLPGITKTITTMTSGVVAFTKNKSAMEQLKAGVIALGIAGGAAALAFIAPWLPAITGFALLGLLVQDFIVGLRGGDSEIGHLIDQLFGQGEGDNFFAEVKKDAEELLKVVKDVTAAIRDVKGLKQLPGKLVDQMKADETANTARQEAGQRGGFLTGAEAQNRGEDEKALIGILKQATSTQERENSMGKFRLPEQVTTEEVQPTIDFMRQANISMDDNMASMTDKIDAMLKARETANAPGAPEPSQQNVNQTNSTTINITTDSSKPDDIADAAGDAMASSNRANLEAVKRAVKK